MGGPRTVETGCGRGLRMAEAVEAVETVDADVWDAISNRRRRHVILRVDRNGPVELGDLATLIAAAENDVSIDEVTSQQRKRVYVGLYQSHLPVLERLGIVESDRSGLVFETERTSDIAEFIRTGYDSLEADDPIDEELTRKERNGFRGWIRL